jgi:hypothetical protein
MIKNKALGLAAIGILLIASSILVLRYAEVSQWFPVLLLFGGVITWTGVSRYRAA